MKEVEYPKVHGSINVFQMTQACLAGMKEITPMDFCWKKEVDLGMFPGCNPLEITVGEKCVEKCQSGYEMIDNSICAEKCKPGFIKKDKLKCQNNNGEYNRKTNNARSRPKTNDCPEMTYKVGPLCFNMCMKLNMIDCGPWACARDK